MTAKKLTTVAMLVLVTSSLAIAFSSGPPDGVTGAPGEGNCTDCHLGNALNAAGGSFSVTAPATYQPGDTLSLTINLARTGQSRWGFEITALDTTNAAYGTLLTTAVTMQKSGVLPNREYIKHTSGGTFAGTPNASPGWSVKWVAPISGTPRRVVFYAAGNAANNNAFNNGDFIYTTSSTSAPDVNQAPVLDSIPVPVFASVGVPLIIPFHAIDPDGDSIIFSLLNQPGEVTMVDSGNGNGFLTFLTTDSLTSGTIFEFLLIASDGALETPRAVNIRINTIPTGPPFFALDVLSTPGGTTDIDRVAYVTQRPFLGAFDLHLQSRADSIGAERGSRDSVDLISILPEDVRALTWRRTGGDPQVILVTSTRPGGSPTSRKGGVCFCFVGYSGDETATADPLVYADSVWDPTVLGEATSAAYISGSGIGDGLFVGTNAGKIMQIDMTGTPVVTSVLSTGVTMTVSSVSALPQIGYIGILAVLNDGTFLLFGPDTLGGSSPIVRWASMGTIAPPVQFVDLALSTPPTPLPGSASSVDLIGNTGFDADIRKITLSASLSGVGGTYASSVVAGYVPDISSFDRPVASGSAYMMNSQSGAWLDPGFTAANGKTPFCVQVITDQIPDSCGYTACLCIGTTGNVDGNPNDQVDIADLTFLVDHLFINNPALPCPPEANVDGVGNIDIADLTFLVDGLFMSLPPFPDCP